MPPATRTNSMTLGEHLNELRRRLIVSILGLIPILILAMVFGQKLLALLLAPAQEALREHNFPGALQTTSPLELFFTYFNVSLIAAVVVGSPWLLFQLWLFVSPGLHHHERRYVYFLIPLSTALTALGILFLFKVILPFAMTFFVTFGSDMGARHATTAPLPPGIVLPSIPILDADPPDPQPGQQWINRPLTALRIASTTSDAKPEIYSVPLTREVGVVQQYRVAEYIRLLLMLSLAFALGFQLPVVILLLGWARLINIAALKKYRKYALFACAIVAAFITPGDPTSMIAMWIPLYLLYELGIALLRFFPAHKVAGKPAPIDRMLTAEPEDIREKSDAADE
ncbi:MAG: twin-arginine translocase subunit TatC [Phycisphaerales bacterium]|nr:MAG: preprotein translocase subunit TatC [Phycisphaerales bacterium]